MQNTISITLPACLVETKEGNTTSDLHGGAPPPPWRQRRAKQPPWRGMY